MLTFKQLMLKRDTTQLPLREQYLNGKIFTIGQIVEDKNIPGLRYEILDRGTNYVTVVNEGELFKKFISDIVVVEDVTSEPTDTPLNFKGYKPSEDFNSEVNAKLAFTDTINRYNQGRISDAIAILKALKATDQFIRDVHSIVDHGKSVDNENVLNNANVAKQALQRIGEWLHHQDYFNTLLDQVNVAEAPNKNQPIEEQMKHLKDSSADQLKVASIIANTFGISDQGNDPKTMVNAAIRKAKLLTGKDSKAILDKMLDMASEVGIEWDKNLHEAAIAGQHRVMVTVSDPHHVSVSQRKDQRMKFIRIPSTHTKESAVEYAKKHYKKLGYKVHGAEHVGLVTEEQLDEFSMKAVKKSAKKLFLPNLSDKTKKQETRPSPENEAQFRHLVPKGYKKVSPEEYIEQHNKIRSGKYSAVASNRVMHVIPHDTGVKAVASILDSHGHSHHYIAEDTVNEFELQEELMLEAAGEYNVGDFVVAKHPTKRYQVAGGKVLKKGRMLTTVKHNDGSVGVYPHKDVSMEFSDLLPNNYRK